MKAYVIKNKEGIYYDGYTWDKELNVYTYLYSTKEDAEYIISKHELKDCTIVPITICEGDLEEEIRHQICEKIRQNSIFSGLIRDDDEIGVYTIEKDVLDQIEKGE